MADPKSLKFTKSHEWITTDGEVLTVGITDHAQHLMGDIVFAELPAVGSSVSAGGQMLTIESPKAAATVYAPVSGEVVEVNGALQSEPETINKAPYETGWIVRIKPSNTSELNDLLDYDAYRKTIDE